MLKHQKTEFIESLTEIFNNSSSIMVMHYHGLTVKDITNLRKTLKDSGAGIKITKNTLTRIASKNKGYDELLDLLVGPTALVYSNDPVTSAKNIVNFSKTNKNLKIIGGLVDGKKLDQNQIDILSKLPPLNEIRAKLVGLISAPASKVATLIQTPATNIARVLNAHISK